MRDLRVPSFMRGAAVAAVVPIAALLLVTDGCLDAGDRRAVSDRELVNRFDFSGLKHDQFLFDRLQEREEREARKRGRQTCRVTWRELLAAARMPLSTPYSRSALGEAADRLGVTERRYAFAQGCKAGFLYFLRTGDVYERP